MLLLFELQIQRVLNDATIGLPYWDWAADGALSPSGQAGSALWQNSGIGGTGRPISNGPFQANVFRVRIESNAFAALRTTDRGLNRELGADPDAPTLPTPASAACAPCRNRHLVTTSPNPKPSSRWNPYSGR
jgi:tyrosinase